MIGRYAAIAALALVATSTISLAQTIGYADAIGRLATGCGQDIAKNCAKVNLGNGRIQQCLSQNQAKVSGGCRATIAEVQRLLQLRAEARRVVIRVCDPDMRRLCQGVQPGDGNMLECMLKAQRSASQSCNQAITDAGYR
jgi:hypothetical protein